jgi:hypothetical protein
MSDSPIEKTIQDGLKAQAKLTDFAILSMLVKADHPPISTDKIKELADMIYTCLYAFQYYNKSSAAEEFLRFHADELRYAEWEPKLVGM